MNRLFCTQTYRYLVLILLLISLLASSSANSKNDSLIMPGHSLGPISLGMTLGEIEEILGSPAQAYPETHTYIWYPRQPSGPLMAIIGPDGKVIKVKVYWDVYYATQGMELHIGMLEDYVRGVLGKPLRILRWSHYRVLYYEGVSFTVDIANVHIVSGIAVVPSAVLAQTEH